jgi:preprotein translocase subunit SecG
MLTVLGILIVIVAIVLGAFILIQNPKGGGLNDSLGGIGNQLIGVKQTTDTLEKGTWIFAGVIAILCIVSLAFVGTDAKEDPNDAIRKGVNEKNIKANGPATPNTQQINTTDTTKK